MMKNIQNNISLKPYNTFGIEAYAEHFVAVESPNELLQILRESRNLPSLILGGGSNILLTQDVKGLVIKNKIKGIEPLDENSKRILIKIAAGENWHEFVRYCVEHEYYGVENLSLIPGTVGAAPIQNIGAYGVELKDVFHSLRAVRLADGNIHEFKKDECAFGYRSSIFKNTHKNQFMITDITLELSKVPFFNTQYQALKEKLDQNCEIPLSIKRISDAVIQIRQEKLPDPKQIGNAGSFFKNPEIDAELFSDLLHRFEKIPHFPGKDKIKIPAAWLIEQCGYKGKRIENIGVHSKQPLVLVNYGNGEGKAIAYLAKEISDSVKNKFAITLEPEVNII